jgi:hypothetical protein
MILAFCQENVVVRGTKSSAQTNFNGEYSIKAKTGDVLVFLLVWLSPQPKLVVHQLLILKCRGVNLNEVVVVGYGKTTELLNKLKLRF